MSKQLEDTAAAVAEALRALARDARRPLEAHEDPATILARLADKLVSLAARLESGER